MINKLCFILLFISNICFSQSFDIKSQYKVNYKNPVLQDLYSYFKSDFSDNDKATVAHEVTHDANNQLSNKYGKGNYYCYYLLNGVCYKLKKCHGKTKLNDIAGLIPNKYRGGIYNLYLIQQQQYFADEPIYLFDEQIAYTHGTISAMAEGDDFRADDSGYRMIEMMIYCCYVNKTLKQSDIQKLTRFQISRVRFIYNRLPKKNPKVTENYNNLMEVLKKEYE